MGLRCLEKANACNRRALVPPEVSEKQVGCRSLAVVGHIDSALRGEHLLYVTGSGSGLLPST